MGKMVIFQWKSASLAKKYNFFEKVALFLISKGVKMGKKEDKGKVFLKNGKNGKNGQVRGFLGEMGNLGVFLGVSGIFLKN